MFAFHLKLRLKPWHFAKIPGYEGMKRKAEALNQRAKGDPRKVALAAKLRQERTLTIAEIARRLQMGTRNTLSTNLPLKKAGE